MKHHTKNFIGFEHHRVHCIIGDLPEERLHEQDIFIDLRVQFDFSDIQDELKNTIDYVSLAHLCTGIALKKQFQMVESLACAITEDIMKDERIESVNIKIKKPEGLPSAHFTIIEREVIR